MAKITTALYGDLALLVYQPEVPVMESVEWLSDVQVAKDGTELVIPLRSCPRRYFSYSVPMHNDVDPDLFNTINGAIRLPWAMPMWTEGQYIGTVGVAMSLACDTLLHDLRTSSLAILWTSPKDWQVLEITTITDTLINLTGNTSPQTNAWLMPLRTGWLGGSVARDTDGFNPYYKLNFELDELFVITPEEPQTFYGYDIYYDVPIMVEDKMETSFRKDFDRIDFDLGVVARRTAWLGSKYGFKFGWVCDQQVEQKVLKDFLYRRQGMARKFWIPTFENNLRIKQTGTIGTNLECWNDSFDAYGDQRTMALLADGVWYARQISYGGLIDDTTIAFTVPDPLYIDASTVQMICWLNLYRLDTDSIDFDYVGNNVMTASFPALSILQPFGSEDG